MIIKNKTLEFKTERLFHFIDFTKEIKDFVENSKIENGLINIQIMHTSAGLIFNENEPLLLGDIMKHLDDCVLKSHNYDHDDLSKRTVNVCVDECKNGHSHCKAIHLSSTVTLNVINGKVQLGQWQSVMLVELDSSRPRKVQLQIIGE